MEKPTFCRPQNKQPGHTQAVFNNQKWSSPSPKAPFTRRPAGS
jgi:hypothetical protein